jgi:hypothetical protein
MGTADPKRGMVGSTGHPVRRAEPGSHRPDTRDDDWEGARNESRLEPFERVSRLAVRGPF